MKYYVLPVFLYATLSGFSQKQPPGLIYSCEKTINGNTQYDIYNSSGQKLIATSVSWAYSNAWSWLFVNDDRTNLRKAYSYFGVEIGIDSIQQTQSAYSNSNRIAVKRNGKWGFYDKQGKLKVLHLYDQVSHFKNGIAAVKLGNDIFMIDTSGVKSNIQYNPSNDDYSFGDSDIDVGMGGDFSDKDYKKISESGKFGLLDVKNNKVIVPAEYENLVDLKKNFRTITGLRNGKYGVVAFGGQIVIPFEYSSVSVLNNYF